MAVPVHLPVINVVCAQSVVSAVKSNTPYKLLFSTLLMIIKKAAPIIYKGCFFRFNHYRYNYRLDETAFMLYWLQSSFASAQFQPFGHQ